ncbi:MAG: ethanolamine ammonia-lyase subunit EutC [Isosphaeraceae bacterium]|nr:ethanolamine ammonia-lyase subunit EutC [Isosphaeraceae bacterium]
MNEPDSPAPTFPDPAAVLAAARERTPARVLVGRAGASYRTATQLDLRQDHAAAVDAVQSEIDLERDLGTDFVRRWNLVEVETQASDKAVYLARPDLGRRFAPSATERLAGLPRGADIQVVLGDGLSAAAVVAQVPGLLPRLAEGAERLGWRFGRPFFIRHCRVGILNEIGARLEPAVVVLLIGERPGLATAESLSAYLAYRPRVGHTDAQRNLISNIHVRGTPVNEAAERVLRLAGLMMRLGQSGIAVKEGSEGPDRLPNLEQRESQ